MSSQEVRNEIIREHLPQLIKCLTGFTDEDEENMRKCENFAWSIIKHHRNLSTNSHEIRRKIEGMQEKFTVNNQPELAAHLQAQCTAVVEHPLCIKHYEVDVGWSLLDFLLTLSYNPTGACRKNKYKIDLHVAVEDDNDVEEPSQQEMELVQNMLKEDFINTDYFAGSDSDLSQWSNSSDKVEDVDLDEHEELTIPKATINRLNGDLKELQPPVKEPHFTLYTSSNCKQRLEDAVQHSWWLPGAPNSCPVESNFMEANFAMQYTEYLNKHYNINLQMPRLATEENLMREIIWMFHRPQNCFFFELSNNKLQVRENVTIPSVSVNGLEVFLSEHFLPYIEIMKTLREFIRSTLVPEEAVQPSKTLECFAANLDIHLEPIIQALISYEQRLVVPKDFQINTLINMWHTLQDTFKQLNLIYDIYKQVVLNTTQHPPHIYSAYLLSSLVNCHRLSTSAVQSNLAISFLLTSLRIFCSIIDTWWTEGRLDDWQNEFIVERLNSSTNDITLRPYYKDKDKSFFVPNNISKVIANNSVFDLLLEHSLEAGHTLNLLYKINRIGDLRNACDAIEGKLYDVFIADYMSWFEKFLPNDVKDELDAASQVELSNASKLSKQKPKKSELLKKLTTKDEFLLLAFSLNMESDDDSDECDNVAVRKVPPSDNTNALQIFEKLQKTKYMLPLEEGVLKVLSKILKTRIAFANSFVMRLYKEEFGILNHLQNIRKVMLLEASDLMHQFYEKLFKQITSGKTWANQYLLTIQLEDILCSRFPKMSSLFYIEINSEFRSKTTKVFEAVDELLVKYKYTHELSYIITPEDIDDYNKVFRFLIKVKWGLMILENLQFARSHKNRTPYAPFERIDFIMRRLELLRCWIMYAIQSIHFHLMTHVLQTMGMQLDEKISNCKNLLEMQMVHRSYVSTVRKHCFLVQEFQSIMLGVEQILNLALILRDEWQTCVNYIEHFNNPLSLDLNDSNESDHDNDLLSYKNIDTLENTYIVCHQYLANQLKNEVYLNQHTFLSGLSATLNGSVPH